jgi:myo-inositol-1(or 4)-monophosphatase
MSHAPLDERMEVAVAAIREAGRTALDYYHAREELSIERKGLQDLVSRADREVETVIRDHLERAFPTDGILGEEHGGALADRLWVIDPIDGTANFLRGIPYWCVVLAFAERGRPQLALTFDPLHDELFLAQAGRGSTRNGRRIRVSPRTDPTDSCIGLSFSFKGAASTYIGLVEALLLEELDHRRLGSSALTLCHVADGRLDALLCPSCNSWDVLAGLLLVQEAGGVATDYIEGASLLDRRAVAASTAGLQGLIERLSDLPLHAAPTAR